MTGMPVLRISDEPSGKHTRRVEVTWQDGPTRRPWQSLASATEAGEQSAEKIRQDAERVRWYLEDYAEFPADPAPQLARDAEAILAGTGTSLFGHVFTGLDAAGYLGTMSRAQLSQVRVEVDTDPPTSRGCRGSCCATQAPTRRWRWAREFVRTHLQATGRVSLPQEAGTGCGCCW